MIAVIIILFLVGIGSLAASFFVKRDENEAVESKSNEYLEQMLQERINLVEDRIGDVAEKKTSSAQLLAQQELERLSKQKISEVNEYSDQVMDKINKNHNEVMFLYSMLSDKQKELDETVENLNKAQKELQIAQRLKIKEDSNKTVSEKSGVEKLSETITEAVAEDNYKQTDKSEKKEIKEESYGKRQKILNMHKEGKTELEIAKQLAMGVGEVRLVLELSKGL